VSLNGISQRYRAGVLAVSPPEYAEMPDEYLTKARVQLLSDNAWLADQIVDCIDEVIAEKIMDNEHAHEYARDNEVCRRIRGHVKQAVEREAPDLAESLWKRDIEASQDAAAEYAADRD